MSSGAIYQVDSNGENELLLSVFEDEASIGTSRDSTVTVNDFRCSGIHLFIRMMDNETQKNGDFYVLDLGSTSGTFISGNKIKEGTLKSGQLITIGTTHLLVKKIASSLAKYQSLLAPPPPKIEHKDIAKERNRNALITSKNLLQASMYWGEKLLEVRTFKQGSTISVGSDKRSTFGITLFEKSSIKIAEYKNESLTLTLPENATGIVWLGNDVLTIKELKKREEEDNRSEITLRIGDKAEIQLGQLSLSFQFVLPPEKIRRFAPIVIDKKLMKILGSLLGVYLLFFLMLMISPEQEDKTVKEIPKKLKKVLFNAGIEEAKKRQRSAIGQILSEQGGRAKGKSGTAKVRKSPHKKKPTPVIKKKETAIAKKTTPKTTTVVAKTAPKKKPVDFSAAFQAEEVSSVSDLVAKTGPKEAGNTVTALASGQYARGTKGFDAGGGGESVGIGQIKGLGTGGGMGAGDMGLSPSKGKEIEIETSEEIVLMDGLDPDIIAAVIKRYLPQIQHCYEARLVHRPELKGKVLVKFKIIGTGSVRSPVVAETTLKDQQVEQCIIQKVKQWKFPKPRGGGVVNVKYPFLLMSTSGK